MPATIVETLKQYIAESRQSEAIEQLLEAWKNKNKSLYNNVLQIKERYNFLQNEIARGVISQPDADLERAKITDALLFLTDRLDNPQAAPPRHLQEFLDERSTKKQATAPWIILSVVSLVILGFGYVAIKNFTAPTTFDLKLTLMNTLGLVETLAHQEVKLFFGNHFYDTQEFDAEGKAIFTDIPNKFKQDSVIIKLENPPYQILGQSAIKAADSDNGSINFIIEAVIQYTNWRGKVTDETGNPIAGAKLEIDSGQANGSTDEQGNFEIKIPRPSGEQVQVTIYYQGRTVYTSSGYTISESQPAQITIP